MTIKRIIVCSLGILSFALNTMAARIDTLSVESPKMKKEIKVAVIVPDQALEGEKMPYPISAARIWRQLTYLVGN